jgi:hypothetical protein
MLAEIDALLEGGRMIEPAALLGLQEKIFLVSLGASSLLASCRTSRSIRAPGLPRSSWPRRSRRRRRRYSNAHTEGIGQVFQRELGVGAAGELPAGEVVGEVVAEK